MGDPNYPPIGINPVTPTPTTVTVPDVDYAYLNLFANKLTDLTTAINNLAQAIRGHNG